jgi:hypothetical protein
MLNNDILRNLKKERWEATLEARVRKEENGNSIIMSINARFLWDIFKRKKSSKKSTREGIWEIR